MPLDSETLGSLRIERTTENSGGGGRKILVWSAIAAALIAAGVTAVLAFGGKTTEVTTVTAEALTTGPSLGNAVLNASGYVVARRMSTVSSKVTGKIAEIFVEEGMAVEKGQVLARLDPVNTSTILTMAHRELEASKRNLAEIEVRLAEAQRNLARNEALVKQQLVSQTALDASKAEVNALAARLAASQAQVKVAESGLAMRRNRFRRSRSKAPFAGVVISKDAQPGEMISPMSQRRVHAHRYRDHRRHGFARSGSGRQRVVHQSREERPARRSHARCLSGRADRGACHQHRAHRR